MASVFIIVFLAPVIVHMVGVQKIFVERWMNSFQKQTEWQYLEYEGNSVGAFEDEMELQALKKDLGQSEIEEGWGKMIPRVRSEDNS